MHLHPVTTNKNPFNKKQKETKLLAGVMNNGIDIPSRDALQHEQLVNIEFEAGYPLTRGQYANIMSFYSCDQIAFRWMYTGNATGNTKCTSTANTVNHAFEYKGIDLLTIKKGTLQVEKVTTSAVCSPLSLFSLSRITLSCSISSLCCILTFFDLFTLLQE